VCCLSWKKVCSPQEFAGLDLLNLALFGHALRLRWLWFEWTEPQRSWVVLKTPYDEADQALFHSSTSVTIGDGSTAIFWRSNWMNGSPLCLQFLQLFALSR
jgi:hypothetical protein